MVHQPCTYLEARLPCWNPTTAYKKMGVLPAIPKTIMSLPKAILAIIFEEVHLASMDVELDSPEQLTDPTLFPYCIAGVCKAWKKLVYSIPGLSTRIVLKIDKPISMKELRDQLKISKGYSIAFYVVRESYEYSLDEWEKPLVQDLMEVLLPHIPRCRVVVFDLLYSSSLPRIKDFRGNAKELRTLKMKSLYPGTIANDSTQISSANLNPIPRTKLGIFTCRNLQYLDLDGHIFMEATRIPGWDESLRGLYRKQLTIYNLTSSDMRPNSNFDLRDFLFALSKLEHLRTLKLISVDLDSTSCFGCNLITIFIQNFHFIGLSRDFIPAFFANHDNKIEASSLILDRCELGEVQYLAAWKMTLMNVAQEEDITAFVSHWDGIGLDFRNCPGLNDEAINLLAELEPPKMANFYGPTLRQLNISSCGPVSVKAIINLVYMREVESNVHDSTMDEGPGLPMFSVRVDDTDVPISCEDSVWLADRLDVFTWHVKPVPSNSPILDWDCSQMDLSQLAELESSFTLNTAPEPRPTQETDSPVLSDDYALFEWPELDV